MCAALSMLLLRKDLMGFTRISCILSFSNIHPLIINCPLDRPNREVNAFHSLIFFSTRDVVALLNCMNYGTVFCASFVIFFCFSFICHFFFFFILIKWCLVLLSVCSCDVPFDRSITFFPNLQSSYLSLRVTATCLYWSVLHVFIFLSLLSP